MDKLPIYEAVLSTEEEGIIRISLVANPAVESLWQTYSKEENMELYSIENEEERIITGCFLRADFPILRKSPQGEYYYIMFSKDTIKEMVQKWMKENRANEINTDHKKNTDVEDIYLQEVFIKNTEKGINPKGFEEIEDGSAFASYKVVNDDVWKSIKEGNWKGFSIECLTDVVETGNEFSKEDDEIMDTIIELIKKLKKL